VAAAGAHESRRIVDNGFEGRVVGGLGLVSALWTAEEWGGFEEAVLLAEVEALRASPGAERSRGRLLGDCAPEEAGFVHACGV